MAVLTRDTGKSLKALSRPSVGAHLVGGRSGVLQDVLKCPEEPPRQGMTWPQMSGMPRPGIISCPGPWPAMLGSHAIGTNRNRPRMLRSHKRRASLEGRLSVKIADGNTL